MPGYSDMTELAVGVAQRCRGAGNHLEERLQGREPTRLCVGDRAFEPGRDVGTHQNVTVPRTLIGIMCTLWVTGVVNRLIVYLNEMSTPKGPDMTPPPPSTK